MTLYEFILTHIRMLNNREYIRENGEINEPAFYRDAFIDRSTWHNMRLGNSLPKKEVLLRLIFALKLNEEEARELLTLGSSSFDEKDKRDLVILALIDIKCCDPKDVYNILDFYADLGDGKGEFDNIYPMRPEDDEEE